MSNNTQAVATVADSPLAMFGIQEGQQVAVPDFAKGDVNAGNENVSSEDQSTVTLKMMQPLSPEVTEGIARPGQWVNSITKEAYDELYLSNIYFEKAYSIFYKRGGSKKGMVSQHPTLDEANTAALNHPDMPRDEQGQTVPVTHAKSPFEIVENGIQYVVVFDSQGVGFPARIFFSKSALEISRQWNTQLAQANNGGARFLSVWKLSNTKRTVGQNTWWVPSVDFAGLNNQEAIYNDVKAIYEALKESKDSASH